MNEFTKLHQVLRTAEEAAGILGVSVTHVYRLAEKGKLSGIPLGRLYFHINEINNLKRNRDKRTQFSQEMSLEGVSGGNSS